MCDQRGADFHAPAGEVPPRQRRNDRRPRGEDVRRGRHHRYRGVAHRFGLPAGPGGRQLEGDSRPASRVDDDPTNSRAPGHRPIREGPRHQRRKPGPTAIPRWTNACGSSRPSGGAARATPATAGPTPSRRGPQEARIVFQYVGEADLRESPGDRRDVGRHLARIHDAGFVHGDPTTRNVRVGRRATLRRTGRRERRPDLPHRLRPRLLHPGRGRTTRWTCGNPVAGGTTDARALRAAAEDAYRTVSERDGAVRPVAGN